MDFGRRLVLQLLVRLLVLRAAGLALVDAGLLELALLEDRDFRLVRLLLLLLQLAAARTHLLNLKLLLLFFPLDLLENELLIVHISLDAQEVLIIIALEALQDFDQIHLQRLVDASLLHPELVAHVLLPIRLVAALEMPPNAEDVVRVVKEKLAVLLLVSGLVADLALALEVDRVASVRNLVLDHHELLIVELVFLQDLQELLSGELDNGREIEAPRRVAVVLVADKIYVTDELSFHDLRERDLAVVSLDQQLNWGQLIRRVSEGQSRSGAAPSKQPRAL